MESCELHCDLGGHVGFEATALPWLWLKWDISKIKLNIYSVKPTSRHGNDGRVYGSSKERRWRSGGLSHPWYDLSSNEYCFGSLLISSVSRCTSFYDQSTSVQTRPLNFFPHWMPYLGLNKSLENKDIIEKVCKVLVHWLVYQFGTVLCNRNPVPIRVVFHPLAPSFVIPRSCWPSINRPTWNQRSNYCEPRL